jgi:hypothetical protein
MGRTPGACPTYPAASGRCATRPTISGNGRLRSANLAGVFHVELRQFPYVARAFNLSAEQLEARIVSRWARDQMVELDDRRWSPERAKLTIYEGRELRTDELGLGHGWANVTRMGEDVTRKVLAAARGTQAGLPELKQRLLEDLGTGQIALSRIPAIAGDQLLGLRASQRLALAEQAVWELLHEGGARLLDGDGQLGSERWQEVLLAWESWSADRGAIFLAAEA